jgi:hypothetical protein
VRSDAELIRTARHDPDAFGELYRRHVHTVRGFFGVRARRRTLAGDLHLDPTKWSVLGGGSTDDGRGAYVHAQRRSDGSYSTFLVEHDAGRAGRAGDAAGRVCAGHAGRYDTRCDRRRTPGLVQRRPV